MCPRKPTQSEIDLLQEVDAMREQAGPSDDEPPAMVDQAVRNMARRALEEGQHPSNAGKLRWITGLSTVSVALIAVGLSLVQSPSTPIPPDDLFKSKKSELNAPLEERLMSPSKAPQAARSNTATARNQDASVMERTAPAMDQAATQRQSPQRSTDEYIDRNVAIPQSLEVAADQEFNSRGAAMSDAVNNEPAPAAQEAVAEKASSESREEAAEAWLRLIRQLLDQGMQDDAIEQLAAWQVQYPEIPLPDWAQSLWSSRP